jgi:hypothetical protein
MNIAEPKGEKRSRHSRNACSQSPLKSAEAKEFVRQSPELKESFASAATAAKTLTKKQAEALSTEESALGKIKSRRTAFRVE